MGILTRIFVVASLLAGALVSTVGYSEGYGGARLGGEQIVLAAKRGGSRLLQTAESDPGFAKAVKDEPPAVFVPGVYAAEWR